MDSDIAVDNRVQPKSRLDKAAVRDEADGLKAPEELLETHLDREGKSAFNVSEIQRLQQEDPTLQPLWKVVEGR